MSDLGYEAIASLRNGSNQRLGLARSPHDFAQDGDVACQRVVTDEGVRPELLHKFFFFYQVTGIFDQQEKCVEDFGRQRNCHTTAPEAAFGHIQTEISKAVLGRTGLTHGRPLPVARILSENNQEFVKTRNWPTWYFLPSFKEEAPENSRTTGRDQVEALVADAGRGARNSGGSGGSWSM